MRAQGRSLRGAMRANDRIAARAAWARRGEADDDVPVALRPRALARALYDRDREGAGQEGREKSRRADAGFFRRLPGDARGDRGRERPWVQAARARKFWRPSRPQ